MIIMISGLSSALVEPNLINYNDPLCEKLIDVASEGKIMPSFAPFDDEVFNIYDLEENSIGHVSIEEGVIVETKCEIVDDEKATYDVFVKDSETIDAIKSAESPAKAYKNALKEGSIEIKGKSFGKGLKIGFINFFAKIAAWF